MELIQDNKALRHLWVDENKNIENIKLIAVNHMKKEEFNNKYSKGLVVIGYQGIGKSSIAGKEKCVDFESSNFWIDDKKDKNWALVYARQALDIADQGYTVLTSSHKEVRDAFQSLPLPKNVGKIVIFCPDFRYKDEWIQRLKDRYEKETTNKNWRALQNAETYFQKNIFELDNNGYFPVYNPAYTPDYDLMDYIHKMKVDWCKNDDTTNDTTL